jgi:hypothetical protein
MFSQCSLGAGDSRPIRYFNEHIPIPLPSSAPSPSSAPLIRGFSSMWFRALGLWCLAAWFGCSYCLSALANLLAYYSMFIAYLINVPMLHALKGFLSIAVHVYIPVLVICLLLIASGFIMYSIHSYIKGFNHHNAVKKHVSAQIWSLCNGAPKQLQWEWLSWKSK